MAFRSILGVDTLKGKSGDVPVASLEGKPLFLYFSAHWCPPCRQFTPVLAKFHSHLAGKTQIVFISSDKDEKQFNEYYHEHPWLALPFDKRGEKAALSKRFKVEGIPTLVLLGADGNVITTNGREIVGEDPEAKGFPWPELSMTVMDLINDAKVHYKDGRVGTGQDLKKCDHFLLYFSAHWCPPCRAFTPELIEVYKKLKAKGKNFELVFVSWDREEKQYREYYDTMPWATFGFQDPVVKKLGSKLDVSGIPTLVVLDGKGNVVNAKARGAVSADPEGNNFPWIPVPMGKVAKLTPDDDVLEAVNSKSCVVLDVTGASDAAKAQAEFKAAGDAFPGDDIQFLFTDGGDLHGRILNHLEMAANSSGKARVYAFFLEAGKTHDMLSGEVTKDAVTTFATTFSRKHKH